MLIRKLKEKAVKPHRQQHSRGGSRDAQATAAGSSGDSHESRHVGGLGFRAQG